MFELAKSTCLLSSLLQQLENFTLYKVYIPYIEIEHLEVEDIQADLTPLGIFIAAFLC